MKSNDLDYIIEKQELVEEEHKRLENIFSSIEENKRDFVKPMIKELAWLTVSCVELQKVIDVQGTVVEYNNGGGQIGFKDNPNIKTLIAYQKNKIAISKILIDLVPTSNKKSLLSEFMNG